MNKRYLALTYLLLLLTGCTRQSEQIWEVLQLCDTYYNTEDTTRRWPEALGLATRLMASTDDRAAWGEYYYQKSCYDITRGDGDSVSYFLAMARMNYLGSKDDEGKAKVLLTSAQYCGMTEQYDSMTVFAKRGLQFAHDTQTRGYLMNELCTSYNFKGDMPEAVRAGNESLRLLEACGDTAGYIVVCGNVGIAYRRQDMNDSAMVCYNNGLKMSLPYGDDGTTAFLYNNLSVLYAETGRYDEALDYATKAERHAGLAGDNIERLSAIANRAEMYIRKEEPDKAVSLLKGNISEVMNTGYATLTLKYINSMLNAMQHAGMTDSIGHYLQEGENIARQMPENSTSRIGLYETKASLLYDNGKYGEALDVLESLAGTKDYNKATPEYKMLMKMARCHAAMGDYRQAYDTMVSASEAADSLRNSKAERQLSEFSVRYRTKEKELEIALLKEENLRRETEILHLVIAFTLVIALLGITLLVLLYKRKLHRKNEEIVMARKYIDGMESERSRLARELHDGVCNDLLGISIRLALPDCSKEQIAEDIRHTHATLRNISHELMPPSFICTSLNDMLEGYISMLTIPDTMHIDYRQTGDGWDSIPPQTAYELYRITQEAVSNIVRHSGATEATVSLTRDGQAVTLDIRDNGKGYDNNSESKGIGLRTIHDRAGSIGASCLIQSDNNGTHITITLHLS